MENEELELFDVFTIGEQTFPNNLREHVSLGHQHIQTAFVEHAELFAWYATAYELASAHESKLKTELGRKYAILDANARQQAKQAGVKMTEKMVENTVITSPAYRALEDDYLEARRDAGLLKAAKDAMIHRRDMLIQMGANYRAEGASDISLRTQAALEQTK